MKILNTSKLTKWYDFLTNTLLMTIPTAVIIWNDKERGKIFVFSWRSKLNNNRRFEGKSIDNDDKEVIEIKVYEGSSKRTLFFNLSSINDRQRFKNFVERNK